MEKFRTRADSERRSEVDRGGRLWFYFATFLQAIAALGAGAVPGSDGVTAKMIKCLSTCVLHSVYKHCLDKLRGLPVESPASWSRLCMRGIPKEAHAKGVSLWRWLTITSSL